MKQELVKDKVDIKSKFLYWISPDLFSEEHCETHLGHKGEAVDS